VTFPAKSSDDPYDLTRSTTPYSEGLLVGYRAFDANGATPLFPFGHGLSYTSFGYQDVTAPASAKPGESISVSVKVRNTGKRSGKEVVQAYIAPFSKIEGEAPRQLRGFSKVDLAPGEAKTVVLKLHPRAFAHYDVEAKAWMVRSGDYRIEVGSSSRDIRGSAVVRITSGGAVP